jgi:hypothetical protein
MAKSHGGRRLGSGRPKGARNKRTVLGELLPRLEATDQELPLYGLLRRIADPDLLDERYKDVLRIATLPYLHSRLVSGLTAKPAYLMSDEELQATREAELEHQRQLAMRRGHLQVVGKKRAALRSAWLQGVENEIERRRQATIEAAGGDPRQQLLLTLAAMGERMRAAPDFVESSEAENAQAMVEIETLSRERGYGRHG